MKYLAIQFSSVLIGLVLGMTVGLPSYAEEITTHETLDPEPPQPSAADIGTVTPSENPFERSPQATQSSTDPSATTDLSQNRILIERQKDFKIELSPLEQNKSGAPFYEEQQGNGTGVNILRVD